MSFLTLNDLPHNQLVLARLDLNSPVENGTVQDNKRFERHAETVKNLLKKGHGVALMAHQGRPGEETFTTLEQHAQILSDHVGQDIEYVNDLHGDTAVDRVRQLAPGEAVLLENTRSSEHELAERTPEEHAANGFVTTLAPHFNAYVNDAYSAAHREHASLVGFPQVLDSYAGQVMAAEYTNNSKLQAGLDGGTTMILGGKKVADVLHVMERLIEEVDNFLLGGVVGELFLRADGFDVGYDIDDSGFMDAAWHRHRDQLIHLLDHHRGKIHLPRDLAFHDDNRQRAEAPVSDAMKREPYWDVGHDTVQAFASIIEESDAVFVKGAPGVFEDEQFAYGTTAILETIARHDCFSVIGGGDTSRAVDRYNLAEDSFSHVSIAGGAYIRALAGEELAAIEALKQ